MVAGSSGSRGSNGHGTNNDDDDNNDADDEDTQVLLHIRAKLYSTSPRTKGAAA